MLPSVAPQEHAAILPVSSRPDNRLFFFKALATKHDKTQVADAAEAVTELDHKYSKFMKELTFDSKESLEFGGVQDAGASVAIPTRDLVTN
jgi:hypothetical protein